MRLRVQRRRVERVLEISACIEWLFAEEPLFDDRIRSAAAAGVGAVEFWTWRDKDIPAIGAALAETGVSLEGFVSDPVGRLVDRSTHDLFAAGIEESSRVASSLGCSNLIVLAGDTLPDASAEEQRAALVDTLRRSARIAAGWGVTLLLEPLNTRVDHVGHYLESTREGLAVVEEVAEQNLLLLLDLYHAAVMSEELDDSIGDRMSLIGHVHAADTPGRHEPGTGTIDWHQTVAWLQRHGYSGRIGLEYQPTCNTTASLAFISDVLAPG